MTDAAAADGLPSFVTVAPGVLAFQRALVWLAGASIAIVFVEPSPYEMVTLITAVLLAERGLGWMARATLVRVSPGRYGARVLARVFPRGMGWASSYIGVHAGHDGAAQPLPRCAFADRRDVLPRSHRRNSAGRSP